MISRIKPSPIVIVGTLVASDTSSHKLLNHVGLSCVTLSIEPQVTLLLGYVNLRK